MPRHTHGLTPDQIEEFLTISTDADLDDTPEPLRAETRRLIYLTLAIGAVTGSPLYVDVVLLGFRYDALLDHVARQEFTGDPDLVRFRVEGAAIRKAIPVLEEILRVALEASTAGEDDASDVPPGTVIRDILSLVIHDRDYTLDEVSSWSLEDRRLVVEWASAVHLRASDHDDVVVPPRPAVLG